jgi:signal transduction histidine kinase/CheY-like chemotaxis protein
MIVPRVARGRTLGAITFVAAESGRRYGPVELTLARDLARRAALAVDNARLFRDSEEALRLLSLLVEASARLTGSLELPAVGEAILVLSHRLVAADAYAIWRRDPTGDDWVVANSAGLSDDYLRAATRVPARGSAMPERPIVVEDVRNSEPLANRREAYRAEGIESLLVVPLRVHGQVAGTIVFYYRTRQRFDEVTVRVATALADLAGAALGTAELYQRQADLRRRAEEADKRKDEFLATLGHELRNPLAVIVTGLHALRELGEVALDRVPAMDRQAAVLHRLVDDVLDMARANQGRIELRREPVRLAEVIARAIETARPVTEAQRHVLEVDLPSDEVWLDADPVRLTQCVSNLLHNAVKYTQPGGHIVVSAERGTRKAEWQDEDAAREPSSRSEFRAPRSEFVEIRVRDTGMGIPPTELERIFELFAQVRDARSRSQGGLGIGLSLVRRLVGMMGGTVTAHSDGPGLGSEFVIRLPAAAPPPTPVVPAASFPAVTPPPTRPLRVVVADDNADAAETLSVLVELWGYSVRVANDGPGAVAAAREFRPDVCLFDIGMPGFDGYEAARRVRAEPGLGGVVLVAMTGFGQDGERSAAAGFDHFMVKPVAPTAVEQLLRELSLATNGA